MNENTSKKSQSFIVSGLVESGLRLCAYYGVWVYSGDVLLQFIVILLGLAEVMKIFKESLCDH